MSDQESFDVRFGELRQLLQQPPSPEGWEAVCRAIERLDVDPLTGRLAAEAIPYALGYLERWPEELRQAPARWTRQLLEGGGGPWLRLVRGLEIEGATLDLQRALFLAERDELRGLRRLVLRGVELAPEVVATLAGAAPLEGLTELVLKDCMLRGHGLRLISSFARSWRDNLRHLSLELSEAELPPHELFVAPWPRLARLDLSFVLPRLSGSARDWMAALPAIEELSLRGVGLRDADARGLAELELPTRLQRLDLSNNWIGPGGVRALAAAPWLARLERLDLRFNVPLMVEGPEDPREIFEARHRDRVLLDEESGSR